MACIAPLFVPGDRPERFGKAATSGADAVIIDLEDAVAPQNKDRARQALVADFTALPVFVRINAPGTAWHDEDLRAVFALPVAGVIVPKAASPTVLSDIARGPHPVLALIETAQGLATVRQVASIPGIVRLIFGSIDYCADLGLAHERESLLLARSELVLASRCAGIQAPIDGVTLALDNAEAIAADASYARRLGFSGKLAIHPRQVEPILQGFRPTADEIAWAQAILSSVEGVTTVSGTMVDEPVRIRARSILAREGLAI